MDITATRPALVGLGMILLPPLMLYELLLKSPVAWWPYAAITVTLALATIVSLKRNLPRRTLVVPMIGIAMAWALYLVPWNSRKPFLRNLYSIQLGMNEDSVRNIMSGYMVGTGWPAYPSGNSDGATSVNDPGTGSSYPANAVNGELAIKNAIVFRHSDDGAYNSDWGIVTFENGRVVSVDFSPD